MRLTLRTLLAYLDNTLDPQDAELLKSKLEDSGFATRMVQRIRNLLTQPDLSAPSPFARGPVEEANVICEYLDSTLPVEQVAEVERACLDSDPHLAEAAACHQILTMVLENPASVPVVLRDRIYQLPGEQRGLEKQAGSFSALAIPEPVNSFDAPSSQVLSSEIPPAPPQEPVRPVGVGDSGVMAAPARLRQSELVGDKAATKGPAIAGSRPANHQSDSGLYGGQIRSSRITPWLVTLGLTAVLLYALTQIFQPLMDLGKTAGLDGGSEESDALDTDDTSKLLDGEDNISSELSPTGEADSEGVAVGSSADSGVDGGQEVQPPAAAAQAGSLGDEAASLGGETAPSTESNLNEPEMDQSDPVEDSAEPGEKTQDAAEKVDPAIAVKPVPQPPQPQPPEAVTSPAEEMEQQQLGENGSSSLLVAKVLSDDTLLAVDADGQWVRLGKNAEVLAQQRLVVAPGFHAELALPSMQVMLVGPSSAMLLPNDVGGLEVRLIFGSLLVSAAKAVPAEDTAPAEDTDLADDTDSMIQLDLGGEKCRLRLATPETMAAVRLTHTRAPALDPLLPGNHVAVRQLIAIDGSVTVDRGGLSTVVQANSQWTQVAGGEPGVEPLDVLPDWATTSVSDADALATTARSNLLTLLEDAPSLEIGLRELLGFRRAEVADLAARTLLGLGKSDVYFGGAGVFSDPRQRAYWSKHYDALLSRVDSGPEAALEVQQAVNKMDAAAEEQLFRMLTGYTDEQLASGSDLQLLENLDSSNMSVRVLAFENLRRITGVTFNYRPEQDSQARREQYMKKWRVRQRKGDIRWQE